MQEAVKYVNRTFLIRTFPILVSCVLLDKPFVFDELDHGLYGRGLHIAQMGRHFLQFEPIVFYGLFIRNRNLGYLDLKLLQFIGITPILEVLFLFFGILAQLFDGFLAVVSLLSDFLLKALLKLHLHQLEFLLR